MADEIAVEPHGELAAIAHDLVGLEAERLIDERRHTGGAGSVISDLAVANPNTCHDRPPRVTG